MYCVLKKSRNIPTPVPFPNAVVTDICTFKIFRRHILLVFYFFVFFLSTFAWKVSEIEGTATAYTTHTTRTNSNFMCAQG